MENPFKWPRDLFYAQRKRSDFNTKNTMSLDCLLKQMYMTECQQEHPLVKLEEAMDTAYYIAVCLANTDYVDEFDWSYPVRAQILQTWKQHFPFKNTSPCPYAQETLMKWMVYAILYLQETKSEEMNVFLSLFRQSLDKAEECRQMKLQHPEDDELDFLSTFPMLIEKWPFRYGGLLSPRPKHPKNLTKTTWEELGWRFNINMLEQALQLYPTIQEQQAFLDWVMKAGTEWGEPAPF